MSTVIASVKLKKGENVNQALKRFKRKFIKSKAIPIIRENKYFTKPSAKRREVIHRSKYAQKKRQELGE